MTNDQAYIERVAEIIESGASVDLFNDRNILLITSNKTISSLLRSFATERLKSSHENSSEPEYLENIFSEFSNRFGLPKGIAIEYIRPPVGGSFDNIVSKRLTEKIAADEDIDKKDFTNSVLDEFVSLFSINREQKDGKRLLHDLRLHRFVNQYFPTDNFHSRLARAARCSLEETRFVRDYNDLDNAYHSGERKIKTINKGKWDSGELAQCRFEKVITEYFGEQFDIHANKPIHLGHGDAKQLPEFDIVIARKDFSHSSLPYVDYIPIDQVVAAFEVKRTLKKQHVELGHDKAKEIIDDRCMALKQGSMPHVRSLDPSLTPYQLLRGKIFFGILSLDVDNDAAELLISGENHAERYLKKAHYFEGTENEEYFSDYAPDVIFCPQKLLWAKESSLMPNKFFEKQVRFFCQRGKNTIDSSVSTFGYLIAAMRRFFIAQGHITKEDRKAYLGNYQYFRLMNSESTKSRILLESDDWASNVIHDIRRYLSTKIPNEYTYTPLNNRPPLIPLKQWDTDEAQDILGYLKNEIKRICKLEAKNQRYDFEDHVFEATFKSLFK
ncbi:DUF6602 domain-containing protein [Vibrio sonorensis]|uniref:DUF6602 domain-containing protein n=1 Tax=Vibrio sonorensis TaxID=1004316 RepID=UPI0008DA2282|nr:DUF6602 domain-containing protein [Vibrio sonorensis]